MQSLIGQVLDLHRLDAGRMPGGHRQKGDAGQVDAHRVGVVSGDTGGAQFLQIERLEVDEVAQRPGDVEQRFAGADPFALFVVQMNVELRAACLGDVLQPADHEARREHDRAAHEHRVGRFDIAEVADDLPGLQEIIVGPVVDEALGLRG